MAFLKSILLISLFVLIIKNSISEEIPDEDPAIEQESIIDDEIPEETTDDDSATGGESKAFECKSNSIMTKILKTILPNPKDPPADAKINLLLFTRTAPRTIIAEEGQVVNLEHSDFNRERKTVIIAHGFLGSGETDWINAMITAYLKYEDVNVILVEWSVFSKTVNYVTAARNTMEVAKQVSGLLEAIVKSLGDGTPWKPIHLIGFSLGAHIVGMTASNFKAKEIWPMVRITALDPAAPCFAGGEIGLDKGDAPFVDVIHTNGNRKFGTTFGILKPMGHIDFYVNGGEIQPGCRSSNFWDISRVLQWSLSSNIKEAACSHTRAAEYFIESLQIASDGTGWPLTGMKWDQRRSSAIAYTQKGACTTKCLAMGITATKPENEELMGKYFVPTASKKPFYEIHDSDRKSVSKILTKTIEEL